MRNRISPEQLFELSKEALKEYPVDLVDQSVSVDDYLKLTCLSILEQFQQLNDEDAEIGMLSAIVVLTLENFLLNHKLMSMVSNNGYKTRS